MSMYHSYDCQVSPGKCQIKLAIVLHVMVNIEVKEVKKWIKAKGYSIFDELCYVIDRNSAHLIAKIATVHVRLDGAFRPGVICLYGIVIRMATLNCVYLNHLVESRFNGEINMSNFGSLGVRHVVWSVTYVTVPRVPTVTCQGEPFMTVAMCGDQCIWSTTVSGSTDSWSHNFQMFYRLF